MGNKSILMLWFLFSKSAVSLELLGEVGWGAVAWGAVAWRVGGSCQ